MKRRLVIVFLALFTFWPLAHRALVAKYDTDPWKFFGWAMYVIPYEPTFVEVVGLRDGEQVKIDFLTAADTDVIRRYRLDRSRVGRFASQEPVARVLLREHRRLEGIIVKVARLRIDRETGLMQMPLYETQQHLRPPK